jgi:hypothetical protein
VIAAELYFDVAGTVCIIAGRIQVVVCQVYSSLSSTD